MRRLAELKSWYGRAAILSILLWPALGIVVTVLMPKRVCSPGRCEPLTPFASTLENLGFLGFYLILIPVIWTSRRYLLLRKVEQFGMPAWRVPAFVASTMVEPKDRSQLVTAEAARLDDGELLGAAHHPDHSEQAKAACVDTLIAHGIPSETIKAWMPPASTLRVPTYLAAGGKPADAWKKRGAFKFFSSVMFLAAIAALVMVALFFSSLFGLMGRGSFRRGPDLATTLTFAAVLAVFFITLFVGTLWLRSRTLRVLLLRPFGERRMTAALKKVVVGQLGDLAHVVTLSDRNYRPNPFLWLLNAFSELVRYVVSPFLHPSHRIASVRNEMTFFRMAHSISKKLKPSFRSLLSAGQAVNIRSTDNWWMRCIDLLMHSTDFIVMDISRVSAGSSWEIEQLGRRSLLDRCIFIVQESQQAEGLSGIIPLLPPGYSPELHVFRTDGKFVNPDAFTRALQQQLPVAGSRQA